LRKHLCAADCLFCGLPLDHTHQTHWRNPPQLNTRDHDVFVQFDSDRRSRTPDFRVFTLNANVVVNLVDYTLRTCQVEWFIAVFDETEYIILAVEIHEIRGLEIVFAHIGVGDFGRQVRHLIKFHGYSSFQILYHQSGQLSFFSCHPEPPQLKPLSRKKIRKKIIAQIPNLRFVYIFRTLKLPLDSCFAYWI
jgi:hypothetical protein